MYSRIWAIGVFALVAASAARPAELKKETLAAWNQYLQQEGVRVQKRACEPRGFLWLDKNPDRMSQVRSGSVVVEAIGEQAPIHVPSGLIHHWIGVTFIPNVRVEDIFTVTRDYARYKDFYKPAVEEARPISSSGDEDEFAILFANNSILSRTTLEGEYSAHFVRLNDKQWYSVSVTKQMEEIKNFRSAEEKRLPPDVGSGYIWRLYSTVRLEERDGGVFMELEAIALSRDIPKSLHWLVDPIVRRVSRDSLEKSIEETAQAVRMREQNTAQVSR